MGVPLACPYCGCEMPPRRRAYCGSVECRKPYDAARTLAFRRTYQAEHGDRYQARYAKPTYSKICAACATSFDSVNRDSRFCDTTCYARSRRQLVHVGLAAPRSDLPATHPAVQPMPPTTPPRLFIEGACSWCDERFTIVDQAQARYCSTRCGRRAGKVRRGRFDVPDGVRAAIYERDRWKCQLCHRRVRQGLGAEHPMAATLDHIVPRSLGGSDDAANLQLAHRLCNSRKHVAAVGEQLRLVG